MRRPAGEQLLRLLVGFTGIAPRWLVLFAFGAIGHLGYLVSRRDRSRALDHLGFALPELGVRDRRRFCRRVFVELYRNGGEVLRFLSCPPRELLDLVEVEGEEHLRSVFDGERGVVAVTGHIGAWELGAGYLAQRGVQITAVGRPLKNPRFDRYLSELRSRLGVTVIDEGGDLRAALRTLRGGGTLGLVVDQTRHWPGVWVPFLGRPARFAIGAAELARRTGARILPMAIQRAGRRHRLTVLPPVDVDWSRRGATEAATASISRSLESLIWRAPEQWTWMYDAWSPAASCAEEEKVMCAGGHGGGSADGFAVEVE
jgi:KDO2-lipid IV(A) lauroyltransferase